MPDFVEILSDQKVLVSDGAWGTSMMHAGLKAGECPEKWNKEHPGRLMKVAKAFVEAGADSMGC